MVKNLLIVMFDFNVDFSLTYCLIIINWYPKGKLILNHKYADHDKFHLNILLV